MARILIVDDAAFMRMMLKDILTKGGFEIAGEAADGNEAVAKYNELKPDLVTLDNYSEEDNPLSLKADFILSLCELVVGGKEGLLPVEKTVIDRCVHLIYRKYFADPCPENMPILEDLYNALLQQDEKEAHHVATALEIYVKGSLNLFNHRTNVNVNNRIVCYDIKELGKQMKKLGMLIVQDQVWGRVTANRSSGKSTRYYMDEIPPLNFEEEQQLEQNILHEGRLLNPIIIWNGFILDGHTRYHILRKHPFIAYQIQEIELDNRYAALSWICQNQLGRRNLDPERKKFLMGKLYESEKLARGGSKERAHDENGRFTSMVQNDPLRAKQLSTCERIAAQNGVGAATVKRAEKYAKGVDAAEDAVPGAREDILTGRIKATDAEITALAKTPKAEIPAALAELRKPKQERQPRKAETASSKQTLSEISKSIQGHQRQLTAEEKTSLKASIDNRYQERAVANGSLMMCEVQGAKEDFIRRWNTIFKEYPDVFEDSDCRKIIHDLTEDAVQYLLKIKEKTL